MILLFEVFPNVDTKKIAFFVLFGLDNYQKSEKKKGEKNIGGIFVSFLKGTLRLTEEAKEYNKIHLRLKFSCATLILPVSTTAL